MPGKNPYWFAPLGASPSPDVTYPGGQLFDPLGLAKDPVAFQEQRVAEVKHGRLAMVAMAGMAAQALATRASRAGLHRWGMKASASNTLFGSTNVVLLPPSSGGSFSQAFAASPFGCAGLRAMGTVPTTCPPIFF